MKTFVEQLSTYAEYHRDQRNIWTHFVGVPMIVLAVMILLSRPAFELAGLSLTPAIIVFVASMAFYLRLHLGFGLIMVLLMGAGMIAAASIAGSSTGIWLSSGIGLFVVGWIIQFVGHHYEGKKPAFVDDLVGLLIGPLFITAEALFALGLFKNLEQEIETRAGHVRPYSRDSLSAEEHA